jgi:Fic/DOC family
VARGAACHLRGAPRLSARPLIRPTLALAVALNHAARREDEWFDEPDDLERIQRALDAASDVNDPVTAAAVLAYRVAWAQAFGEGNKRTAFLLAKWILDRNGHDGSAILFQTTGKSPISS